MERMRAIWRPLVRYALEDNFNAVLLEPHVPLAFRGSLRRPCLSTTPWRTQITRTGPDGASSCQSRWKA